MLLNKKEKVFLVLYMILIEIHTHTEQSPLSLFKNILSSGSNCNV